MYITTQDRFELKFIPEPMSGCWLWMHGVNGDGYGSFFFNKEERSIAAHRAAYRIYVGQIPDGLHVLHRCDTPPCVNPVHLFLGTIAENNADRSVKGRTYRPFGRKAQAAKLSEDIVLAIRASNEMGITLAKRYGVLPSTISAIRTRTNWGWL